MDSLALFALSSAGYLLRIYILWTLVYSFSLLYILLASGLIYFVTKFLNLEPIWTQPLQPGNPQVLADALIKIGYKRIQLERTLPIHIINGLRWNSHLPVSFRVRRLRRLDSVNKIKHHSSYRSKTTYVNWWKACAASSDL
ncbi:hypothetical protein CW706_06595 [Candidatus Bathyarchaeota archaeon]|nr:MAG: hypothetical protein CW706_06595 [Candidatus Bathyarchaeota archaeon]